MNKARRDELARARGLLEEAKAIIEQCASEERNYYDAMHENLQSGEKGSRADEVASQLEELESMLDDGISTLEESQS